MHQRERDHQEAEIGTPPVKQRTEGDEEVTGIERRRGGGAIHGDAECDVEEDER